MRIHQLSKIFIAGGYQSIDLLLSGLAGIGADNIIRLDPRHDDHRITQCFDQRIQRLYLRTQFIRHRRAMRFVLFIHIVTKSFSLGVEHHRDLLGLVLLSQFIEHIDDAVDRTGRLAFTVGQRW